MYPSYPGETRRYASYAFHEMLKHFNQLEDIRVRVINLRLRQLKIFNVFNKVRLYNTRNKRYYISFIDGVEVHNIPIFKLPKLPIGEKKARSKSKIIINELAKDGYIPDIIISITTNTSKVIAEYLKEYYSCPIILSVHNCDIEKKRANKTNFERIDFFSFRSNRIKRGFLGELEATTTNYSIDTFGIDESSIIPIKEKELRNQHEKLSIISVGSLIPLKNFDDLIRAIAGCTSYIESLDIYGEGNERRKLMKIIEDNNLRKIVMLHGEKPKNVVFDSLRRKDVFALVSSPETLGLSYLEALSKGCIVIGSKGEGIDGVIEDEKNGFLCEPKNIDMLKAIIKKIYSLTLGEKVSIIENGLETAMKNTNQHYIKKYVENCKIVISNYHKL